MSKKQTNTRSRNNQSAVGRRINGRRDLNIVKSFFANESSALELASDYGISVGLVIYRATSCTQHFRISD